MNDPIGKALLDIGFSPEVAAAQRAPLIEALQALLRCPGIDQTDQEQGETFRTIAETALEHAGVKKPIDTTNKFMVSGNVKGQLLIVRPPGGPISQADALNLAAYLVALGEGSFEEFQKVYMAVCGT